jgi:formylglycine-generating enzyme required for sulfatase activity
VTAVAIDLEDVVASHGPDDPSRFIAIADHFLTIEDLPAAAAALDRAYGLLPDDAHLARLRAEILDRLAVREHGLVWRYIPAGTFLMGSAHGDPDERPVHPRRLAAFWIADAPLAWSAYCALAGWNPPPGGRPTDEIAAGLADHGRDRFLLTQCNKIRRRYCVSELGPPRPLDAEESMRLVLDAMSGAAGGPDRYARKPMIAVTVREAERLAAHLSTPAVRYALPTEAQWEKAARGGLAGRRYAWGDAPPTPERCDFDRMGDFRLIDPRALPPNGYGLHGMCGGVSEWTADIYDALAYRRATAGDLAPPAAPSSEPQRVLRGGSWIDCADAVTVSHRTARGTERAPSPTIGFRLVRTVAAPGPG